MADTITESWAEAKALRQARKALTENLEPLIGSKITPQAQQEIVDRTNRVITLLFETSTINDSGQITVHSTPIAMSSIVYTAHIDTWPITVDHEVTDKPLTCFALQKDLDIANAKIKELEAKIDAIGTMLQNQE